MNKVRLDPYLFFKGNCKTAMEFYKGVFGGELKMQTVGDVPGDMPGKEKRKNEIMHASLSGGLVTLFGCDSPGASPAAAKIELCLSGNDDEKLRGAFDALAKGGKVKMPLEKQFWGDEFGNLTDKFGLDWMVNIEGKK